MTANEMKYNWSLLYDKAFEYSAPAYDDRQASTFLTKAQLRVVKRKIARGIETSEARRIDLQQLITSGTPTKITVGTTSIHPNGVLYQLPSDFLYALEESIVTNISTPNEIKVLPVPYDYYRSNISNPYKKPYGELAWRMDIAREDSGEDGGDEFTGRTNKRVEIITASGTTISSYRIIYLKEPPAIVCNELDASGQRHCILDESLHDEIVDEAVKIAVAATTPEVYQISDKEQKENEF